MSLSTGISKNGSTSIDGEGEQLIGVTGHLSASQYLDLENLEECIPLQCSARRAETTSLWLLDLHTLLRMKYIRRQNQYPATSVRNLTGHFQLTVLRTIRALSTIE